MELIVDLCGCACFEGLKVELDLFVGVFGETVVGEGWW